MPIAQFRDEVNKISITRSMLTPKKITSPDAWLRAARRAIPQIPNLTEYYIAEFAPTLTTILITLNSPIGHRCYVAIQRH